MITLYRGVLRTGRTSKMSFPAHFLPSSVNRLKRGENILVSAQRFNTNANSNNNKNGYHLLSLFYVRSTVLNALHLPQWLVTTTLLLLSFIIPTLPIKELKFWENKPPFKVTSWLSGWAGMLPQATCIQNSGTWEPHNSALPESTHPMKILPSKFYRFPLSLEAPERRWDTQRGTKWLQSSRSYNTVGKTWNTWKKKRTWWEIKK